MTTTPPPSRGRVTALDALRGVAVMGIVPMNVIAFAMPASAYINPRAYGFDGGLDAVLWAASFLIIEDKFRALFAMMFGAGIAILIERGGPHPLRGHYARMAALAAIALAHAILLASNDVLRSYAVCGALLPLVLGWRVRNLLIAAAALMLGQLLVSGYVAWGWLRYWAEQASGTPVDPAPMLEAERRFGADGQVIADALARGRESFAMRIDRRLAEPMLQARAVGAAMPSTLAGMLAGVALWRCGLLAGEWAPARALRLARHCLFATLPPLALMMVWNWATGFNAIVTAFNAMVLSAPFDLVLGVGYAALAMALFGSAWRDHALTARLVAAGRMALSCYLGTSLVFAALFAAWGLGLFGEVYRSAALALGLVPMALMLILPPLWLARFRQGPAEWLWRSLAAGRALPIRRPA